MTSADKRSNVREGGHTNGGGTVSQGKTRLTCLLHLLFCCFPLLKVFEVNNKLTWYIDLELLTFINVYLVLTFDWLFRIQTISIHFRQRETINCI